MLHFDSQMTGLGTAICWLSFLSHSGNSITVHTSNQQAELLSVVYELKTIYDISESKIFIKIEDHIDNFQNLIKPSDTCKLLSPYIKLPGISKYKKPCIGIACANTEHEIVTKEQLDQMPGIFPANRYYPIEVYSKIFELAKRAGYDIITFDSTSISLKQKVQIMSELCDAVIGYEGGLCHIAHTLDIPTIILPWQRDHLGNILNSDTRSITHLLHLDTKTFFLNHISEILAWTTNNLITKIEELKNDQGNNYFLNNKVRMKADLSMLYAEDNEIKITDAILKPSEQVYLKNHCSDLKLGGIREIEFI
jgi:hypothetical protein